MIFVVQEATRELVSFIEKRFPVPLPSLYMIFASFLYRPVEFIQVFVFTVPGANKICLKTSSWTFRTRTIT
jgi:hypothetical protein